MKSSGKLEVKLLYTFCGFSATNANNIYSWMTTGVCDAWERIASTSLHYILTMQ